MQIPMLRCLWPNPLSPRSQFLDNSKNGEVPHKLCSGDIVLAMARKKSTVEMYKRKHLAIFVQAQLKHDWYMCKTEEPSRKKTYCGDFLQVTQFETPKPQFWYTKPATCGRYNAPIWHIIWHCYPSIREKRLHFENVLRCFTECVQIHRAIDMKMERVWLLKPIGESLTQCLTVSLYFLSQHNCR